VERVLGAPTITAAVDRGRLARYGVRVEDAFAAISASREGVAVGHLYEEERRFEIRVLLPPSSPSADGIGELFVPTQRGENIPLREVVELTESEGPTAVRRENRMRAIRVDVNLRGRDLVSWVNEAQAAVAAEVRLPNGYRAEWGGQFENFARAQQRLAIVLPIVVLLIFGMLLGMFQNVRLAVAVFALVPLSLAGGMLGLTLRGMPFSLPPKNMFRKNVCSMSSRWWPRATLVAPSSSATRYRMPRRRREHRLHIVLPGAILSLTIEYVSWFSMWKGTPVFARYSGSTCSGKPGCFWSRLTAISSKSTGARCRIFCRMSSMA
jgi:hypothetical protein